MTRIHVNRQGVITAAVAMALFLGYIGFGFAQKKDEKIKVTKANRQIQGEVVWVGKSSLSVLYRRDKDTGGEYEILVPYDPKELKVQHKNALSEIAQGDTIRLDYEEIITEDQENKENTKTDFKAKVITFIKAAPAKEGALVSDEEPLPLKGLKD